MSNHNQRSRRRMRRQHKFVPMKICNALATDLARAVFIVKHELKWMGNDVRGLILSYVYDINPANKIFTLCYGCYGRVVCLGKIDGKSVTPIDRNHSHYYGGLLFHSKQCRKRFFEELYDKSDLDIGWDRHQSLITKMKIDERLMNIAYRIWNE